MKHKDAQFSYDQMEQILNLYGNDDIKRKIVYVKNFLEEKFGIDEIENSSIEIERIDSKRLMWLFVSLLIHFEAMKEDPKEQLSKKYKFGYLPPDGD